MDSTELVLKIALIAACTGSGMMAGLFSSFSSFTMKALASLSSENGIAAMQAINRLIVRPSFLCVFIGTGVLGIITVLLGWKHNGDTLLPLLATAIYILACIVSTILFNIPLNNRLAIVDPSSEEGSLVWKHYVVAWTRWNHIRAVATLVSTLLFGIAISDM